MNPSGQKKHIFESVPGQGRKKCPVTLSGRDAPIAIPSILSQELELQLVHFYYVYFFVVLKGRNSLLKPIMILQSNINKCCSYRKKP